ncbi:serine/threonine-protein kinase [Streptomyces sp. NPDC048275]|uniref:serine/threonine-protein kinase n=1 Tax=Streptomyces sp. NPDC048275 TaxID=3155629 RepID=UPI00340D8116
MRALRPGTDPRRLGPYRLLAILGTGGMATVYLANARRRGSAEAELAVVKTIRDDLSTDSYALRLFRREVEALKQMDAYGTLRLLKYDLGGGKPWFATEYVPGLDLRSLVNEHGPLRTATVLRFAAELATILVRLKTHKMVHRDLKPSNILILSAADGSLRLIDFGIVRRLDQTRTWPAVRVGTDGFMAPEQLYGDADHPSDMFALGLTLVYAARGTEVMRRDLSEAAAGRKARFPADTFSGLDPLLIDVVQDCTRPEPTDRITADDLLRKLAIKNIHPVTPAAKETWLPDTARSYVLNHAARTDALVPQQKPTGAPPTLRDSVATEPRLRWSHHLGGRGYFASPVATPGGIAVCSLDGSARMLAAADGKTLWQSDLGTRIECAPAVGDGLLFVSCSDRTLRALNLADGSEQWRYAAGDSAVFTPAVAGNRVLAGARDGSVHCLATHTGARQWVSRPRDGTVFDRPVVDAETVYVSAWEGTLHALALCDGSDTGPLPRLQGMAGEPALSGGVLYVGIRTGTLCAIDARTGNERWRNVGGPSACVGPAVADAVVCVGGGDRSVRAYDTSTGTERWKADVTGRLRAAPVADAGTLYVGAGNELTAFSATDGTVRWRHRTHGAIHAPPVIADGQAYVGSWSCRVEALVLPPTG